MELKLYNTLTRKKEVFRPLDELAGRPPADWRVRMYVCGPTVYDFAHIGNARPVIVFDVLYRLLRHLYGADHVKYVRNITDVDDKINARAAEEYPGLALNEAIRKVTEKTERQFHEDVAALGCLKPDVEPRATEHIEEMKQLIERLLKNHCAYVEQDHVLFHVAAMQDYGKLANRSLDEMLAGARVDVAPYKRDPMDFVLWKPSKPGEPAWPSPGGIKTPGRPGWHIECSAMSWKHLGEEFDIHGGGIDLVFPHHENELAQTRCAFHSGKMAQVWMHNGFLQVEGAKMSKSLGNFVTIDELLRTSKFGGRAWPGAALRLAMLSTHYHQPIDWTLGSLTESWRELRDWSNRIVTSLEESSLIKRGVGSIDLRVFEGMKPSTHVVETLSDDLNTPLALSYLRGNKPLPIESNINRTKQFFVDLRFLGILDETSVVRISSSVNADWEVAVSLGREFIDELITAETNRNKHRVEELVGRVSKLGFPVKRIAEGIWRIGRFEKTKVQALVDARNAARKAKDFKKADDIRKELTEMGVVLKDNKDGTTTWEVAR